MKKLKPNHIPAKGWKGGFLNKHPKAKYPDPDLKGIGLTQNLDNIGKLTRQQRVLWPEFTWETRKGKKDPKRCFQMFAPDISRIGYDNTGQSWSVICPQQGVYLPGFGTMNVEVTVTKQGGWVDETNKSMAVDMVVKPKIWFSPSAHQSSLGQILWALFDLNYIGFGFPSEKDKAITLNTFRTDAEKTTIINIRDGLFMNSELPHFTLHPEAWNHANVEVEIGDIDVADHPIVAEFNNLVMKAFNIASGNMLQKGNILAWNVWFDAPSKVDRSEWINHADVWRRSIDVDHCSPDGNSKPARYANGQPFSVEQELIDEVINDIIKFIKKHLP
ncbi:hypothetical protein [Psychroserpens damuponensis]|uniref:hypothetical protein n=1 Tax=Psychroserpens damuponensis TaxID=943936 RepID=UPI00058F3FA7|nr:hypothetical protein [Psychroserpens damuponensis]